MTPEDLYHAIETGEVKKSPQAAELADWLYGTAKGHPLLPTSWRAIVVHFNDDETEASLIYEDEGLTENEALYYVKVKASTTTLHALFARIGVVTVPWGALNNHTRDFIAIIGQSDTQVFYLS